MVGHPGRETGGGRSACPRRRRRPGAVTEYNPAKSQAVSTDLLRLPTALRARLERELRPRERLVYAGLPSPWRTALPTVPLFVFGLFWTSISGFIAVLFAGLLLGYGPSPPPVPRWLAGVASIVGMLFVLVGVLLLASPFYRWLKARRTVHAVTGTRLLTVVDAPWRAVESVETGITSVQRKDIANGAGTLAIGCGTERDAEGDPIEVLSWWRGIPDVERAEDAVRALVRKLGSDG